MTTIGQPDNLAGDAVEERATRTDDRVKLEAFQTDLSADADLRAVVEAWPELSDAVKVGILAMVRVDKST